MAFYRFARLADDIADHATASADEKLARLEAMRAGIVGTSDAEPSAVALRAVMAERRLDPVHALDLLEAFRRDCTKNRYADWDDLIDYCRYSAMPVGRFVLDVHGEDRALWPANDALCAALQVINHLQDCGKDYREIDRVYLPQDLLAAAGARTEDLARSALARAAQRDRGLRRALPASARRRRALRAQDRRSQAGHRGRGDPAARGQPRRAAAQRDPLSERVHHGKGEALLLASGAALGRLVAR